MAFGAAALVLSGRTIVQAQNHSIRTTNATNAWLRIAPDDTVTIKLAQSEMGQGIATTLPLALADELDADWSHVKFEWADFDQSYRHPQYQWMFTGNSESISTFFPMMRTIGAAARTMLIKAAAKRLDVRDDTLRVENGRIHHDATKRVLSFGAVASDAAKLEAPKDPPLKPWSALRLIGKPQQRVDIPSKVDGSAVFGIDVKVPGMLVAAIRRAPSPGGSLVRFDAAAIKAQRGVEAVIEIPSGLAVVAKDYWTAKRAVDNADLAFMTGPIADYSTQKQRADYAAFLTTAAFESRAKVGESEAALAAADKVLAASFEIPAQAHASMEPMNCTAHVTADRCELWIPTQGVEITHAVAKQMTGLSDDSIIIHRTMVGGGFGRRLLADFAQLSIVVAKAVGRPVKVIWSREEDFRYDAYRPPMAHAVTASLGRDGLPVAMTHRVVSPSHMLYIFPRGVIKAEGDWARPIAPPAAYDGMAVEGLVETPYAISNYSVELNRVETPLPVSVWRTTGHGPNNFVLESFIDELAHAAGKDPLAYRLALAAADPRAVAVLKAVADMSDWGKTAPAGRTRGLALAKAFGGFIAQAVELSVRGKEVKCHRVWSAADIGQTLDPGIATSNIEGGIVWGLSGLRTEATFTDGEIQQTNFDQFDPLHLWETPAIETRFIESGAKPTGVGELGPVPTHAAVCNAIFAATGDRIRSLPISRSGYRLT
ncbi:molybdopterin cofactor-binding domain-containing protein [Bradyrhizobium manausense]